MDKSARKKIFWNIFSLLLAAVTVWAVFAMSGEKSPSEIMDELRDASNFWTVMAVAASMLYVVFEGCAIVTILRSIGQNTSLMKGLLCSASDAYFSAVTPSATGGQPAAVFFMIRQGVPAGTCALVMLVNLILYTLATMILGLLALLCEPVLFQNFRPVSKILVGAGFVTLCLLVILFFSAMGRSHRLFDLTRRILSLIMKKKSKEELEEKIRKIDEMQYDFALCASMMKTREKAVRTALALNIAQRASQIAVPMFLYIGMGGRLSMGLRIFAAQSMVTLGYSCVPVPGAMGVADLLMIDAFTDLIGAEDAFMLEMLGRGVSFYLCTFVSGLVVLGGYMLIKFREKRASS